MPIEDMSEKFERLCEWTELHRLLVREIIRRRKPHYTDQQVRYAMGRIYLGNELFTKAFGDVDAWF